MSQIVTEPASLAPAAMRPVTLPSLGAMLLLALMWGLSIPVTKLGLATMPPLTLTALRFAFALPLMLLLLIGRKPLPLKALPAVASLGVLGIGIGQVTQTFGVAGTSASVGTILSATIPLFIVFFAAIRLGQPVSRLQLTGVSAAFAGIVVVALENAGGSGSAATTMLGPIWMLVSALAVAFYYVWSVELSHRHGTVVVATWSTFFGFLALAPWAGLEAYRTPFEMTEQALGAAAYLGLIVTAAGLFLWLRILREVPAPVAASIQYLQPVFGITASALMFGDRIGLQFMTGVALILAGVALAMRTGRRRA
ncbi:DMT family transporter [Rhizobium sp. R634]|uniref:DMT family transporter n=1 Tax=Rhizobium sp. R634 TaxID=1764274 RepID=UPI001FD9CD4C|nr:DMT family transporter [Rhizobium sp. R634]